MKRIWLFLLILIFLVPLGLLTDYPAWGEWSESYFKKILGFVPKGIQEHISYTAPIPDYDLNGLNPILGYYISAIIGVGIIFLIFYMIGYIKKND
ncbi:PDGLE domain-containing protein [Hydrogenothermus marinus]|uniref:Cobalt/nickel transport protein n=1 Tax=Hydrogenothermus marinus TaxID=133270 RepID=A0A3M0BSN0_9AQUI|nr:PDGLE domain-containing protein [Hydrogenothermus marinus]RMA97848.1 cobalt/nickel transport protein [Hydrogenothermus marinus]